MQQNIKSKKDSGLLTKCTDKKYNVLYVPFPSNFDVHLWLPLYRSDVDSDFDCDFDFGIDCPYFDADLNCFENCFRLHCLMRLSNYTLLLSKMLVRVFLISYLYVTREISQWCECIESLRQALKNGDS